MRYFIFNSFLLLLFGFTANAQAVIYVNQNAVGTNNGTSWTDAYTELETALAAAGADTQLWIAAGTYTPDDAANANDRTLKFTITQANLELYGGFVGGEADLADRDPALNQTILSGEIQQNADSTDNAYRVVDITATASNVRLNGLTVQHGFDPTNLSGGTGGIRTDAGLFLENCKVIYNTSNYGGGIKQFNAPFLEISGGCVISHNVASKAGGGVNSSGNGVLRVYSSKITNNSTLSQEGGGLYIDIGVESIILDSEISNNRAAQSGGGIIFISIGIDPANPSTHLIENTVIADNEAGVDDPTYGGGGINADWSQYFQLTIKNSAVVRNTAASHGGGLYVNTDAFYDYVEVKLINTTVSENTSTGGKGGGIIFDGYGDTNPSVNLYLINSTITGNRAQDAANGMGGGLIMALDASGSSKNVRVYAKNTIIAGNIDALGYPDINLVVPANNFFISQGNNLIGNLGGFNFDSNTTGDIYGDPNGTTTPHADAMESTTAVDPLLEALADNGGNTLTQALLPGSPAINAGDIATGESLTADQRGTIYLGAPDMGAYEYDGNFAPMLDNTGDITMTAIDEDNANPTGDPVDVAGLVTDLNTGDAKGVAVVAADNTNGAWQYSLDAGTSWGDMGNPSMSAALLLPDNVYVRFVPIADYNGTIEPGLSFHAWDLSSGSVGGNADLSVLDGFTAFSTAMETVSITVNPVNDAPAFTASGDITVEEDFATVELVTITPGTVHADETGQSVTYSMLPATVAFANINFDTNTGLVSINAIADANSANTSQVFTITANDGQVANNTHSETFTLTVNPVNDTPAFTVSGNVNVDEDFANLSVTVTASIPPSNETDQVVTYSLSPSTVDFAVMDINTGTGEVTIIAIPDAHTSGVFQILTITADDGQASNNTHERDFTITINPVEDAPLAIADSYSVGEDEELNIDAPNGVLANDSDAEGDALEAINLIQAASGTVVLNTDGSFVFTPEANYFGSDSFNYTVNDGTANGNTVTVTLTINPINDIPVVAGAIPAQSVDQHTNYSFVFDENTFSDVDGDLLTYSATLDNGSELPAWLSFNATTRTFSGTPADNDVAVLTVRVTATDPAGALVYNDFTLTVNTVTGIEEDVFTSSVSLHPNPSHGSFTLSNPDKLLITKIVIRELSGKMIYTMNQEKQSHEFTVKLPGIKSGVYFLEIYDGQNRIGVQRLLVEK